MLATGEYYVFFVFIHDLALLLAGLVRAHHGLSAELLCELFDFVGEVLANGLSKSLILIQFLIYGFFEVFPSSLGDFQDLYQLVIQVAVDVMEQSADWLYNHRLVIVVINFQSPLRSEF